MIKGNRNKNILWQDNKKQINRTFQERMWQWGPDLGKHPALATAMSRNKNSGLDLQFGMNMTDQSNTPGTDPGIILLSDARDILSKQPEDYL